MTKHEYYKLHAWVAGILLSVDMALFRLDIIDSPVALIAAAIVLPYLAIALILTIRTYKEKKSEAAIVVIPEKRALTKDEAKLLKKIAKKKLKAEKKKAKD